MEKRRYEFIPHEYYKQLPALIYVWFFWENYRLIEPAKLYRCIYRDCFSITHDFHFDIELVDTEVIDTDPQLAACPRGYQIDLA